MAPPLLSRPGPDGRAKKMVFGGWMHSVLRLLAPWKTLRGSWLDPFGRSAERREERRWRDDYAALLEHLAATLSAERLPLALELARLPESVRGYGHVKLANLALARAKWADLRQRWDAAEPGGRQRDASARSGRASTPA